MGLGEVRRRINNIKNILQKIVKECFKSKMKYQHLGELNGIRTPRKTQRKVVGRVRSYKKSIPIPRDIS